MVPELCHIMLLVVINNNVCRSTLTCILSVTPLIASPTLPTIMSLINIFMCHLLYRIHSHIYREPISKGRPGKLHWSTIR